MPKFYCVLDAVSPMIGSACKLNQGSRSSPICDRYNAGTNFFKSNLLYFRMFVKLVKL